ncbi:MAG: DUF4105 domain-containing protein [Spirochaetales bacterium]|nr:DUF4105 domain-containing protein [Spirochaetales bacterium]
MDETRRRSSQALVTAIDRTLIRLSALFLCLYSVAHARGLSELQQQAEARNLHEDRYWQLLLHYRKEGKGMVSEADGVAFFLAADGKINPLAELRATIAAFLEPIGDDPEKHARCRFPLRYRYLRSRLDFPPHLEREQPCALLAAWISEIQAESVSLVFSSYYMNAPASMFGHTFLKFNARKNEDHPLLDWAINFAANPGETGLLRYALYGLAGGYPGNFSVTPYHLKVNEYNNRDNRDLWIYELDFSAVEIESMLLHAWELNSTYFDYYYLDENCSYHLLSLLEIARPSLDLTASFQRWVLPSETVAHIVKKTKIVKRIDYRPSHVSQIQSRLEELDPAERGLFFDILKGNQKMERIDSLSGERQLFLGDLLLSATRLRRQQKPEEAGYRELYRELIAWRLARPASDERYRIYAPRSTPPEFGHNSFLSQVGGGQSTAGSFGEIRLRPAYHDLLNRGLGYAPNAEYLFFDLRLRHYPQIAKTTVPQFHLLKISSFQAYDRLTESPAYVLDIGSESRYLPANLPWTESLLLQTLHIRELLGGHTAYYVFQRNEEQKQKADPFVQNAYIDFQFGLAPGKNTLLLGLIAGGRLEGGPQPRAAPAATIQLIADGGLLRLVATSSFYAFALTAGQENEWRHSLALRGSLSRNLEIRLEVASRGIFQEASLGLVGFF